MKSPGGASLPALNVPRLVKAQEVCSRAGTGNDLTRPGLTEILAHVEQDPRRSSVQLVEERGEAEEQQSAHAEAIIPQ